MAIVSVRPRTYKRRTRAFTTAFLTMLLVTAGMTVPVNAQAHVLAVALPAADATHDGLPVYEAGQTLEVEITFSEAGASTEVTNVKWKDVIWSGPGVSDEGGESRDATVIFQGEGPFEIGLENKTSSDGGVLIIIPLPIPLPPFGEDLPVDPAPIEDASSEVPGGIC